MDQFVAEKKLEIATDVAVDGEGSAENYFHACTNEEAEERRSNLSGYLACFCVTRGTGLAAMDPNGSSDPYVMVAVVPAADSDASLPWDTPRSVVKKKTLEPLWNFGWSCMRDHDIGGMSIVVEVWDKDKFSQDDFMGRVVLPVADLSIDKTWYPLTARPGSKSKVQGFIQVIGRYSTPSTFKRDLEGVPLPLAEVYLQSLERRQESQSTALLARLAELGFSYAPGPSTPPDAWVAAIEDMATKCSPPIQHSFVKDAYKVLYPGTVLAGSAWTLEMSTFLKSEGEIVIVVVGLLPNLGLLQCVMWEPSAPTVKRRAFIKFIAHHFRTKRHFSRSVLSMVLLDTNRYYLEGPAIVYADAGKLAMYAPGRSKDGALEIFQRSDSHYGLRNAEKDPAKSWQWTREMHNQCIVGGLTNSLVVVAHGVRASGSAWSKIKKFFKEPSHKTLSHDCLSSHCLEYIALDEAPSSC